MSLLKKGFFTVGFFAYIQTIKTQKLREKKKIFDSSICNEFQTEISFSNKLQFQINYYVYYFKSIAIL